MLKAQPHFFRRFASVSAQLAEIPHAQVRQLLAKFQQHCRRPQAKGGAGTRPAAAKALEPSGQTAHPPWWTKQPAAASVTTAARSRSGEEGGRKPATQPWKQVSAKSG